MPAQGAAVDEPPSTASARFETQGRTVEDLLSENTVGLVTLSDYRKRRAEVADLKEREARDALNPLAAARHASALKKPSQRSESNSKKRKKNATRPKLSFDPEGSDDEGRDTLRQKERASGEGVASSDAAGVMNGDSERASVSRHMGPNKSVAAPPKLMTHSALAKEAALKEQLRLEYMKRQEVVRDTRIQIPFSFYNGKELEGGSCMVRKGQATWYFLDLARNVGVGIAASTGDNSRKDWHRISVDDLMLVKNGIIIPQHYEFYFFILHQTKGYDGQPLFDYSREPIEDDQDGQIEGTGRRPKSTLVVDRRWYERNKHIFPVSTWEVFDPDKNYAETIRRDPRGNRYFFS